MAELHWPKPNEFVNFAFNGQSLVSPESLYRGVEASHNRHSDSTVRLCVSVSAFIAQSC